MVKHLPAMQDTGIQSLGQEDPPKEENGNSLQYSCLENLTDRSLGGYSPWDHTESVDGNNHFERLLLACT